MLSFTVRIRFEQDDIEKVAELLGPLTSASRKEVGCVTYIPHFVEDDPTIRQLLTRTLASRYAVVAVENGAAALVQPAVTDVTPASVRRKENPILIPRFSHAACCRVVSQRS